MPEPAFCNESGSVTITVQDAVDATAIASARVSILGSAVLSSRFAVTDAQGEAPFSDVAEGSYTLVVQASKYEPYRYRFEVLAAQRVNLKVTLVRLPVIGNVSATRLPRTVRTVDETAPQARTSPSLIDALGELSGVDLRNASGRAAGISLDGRDPSLTNYAFNGVVAGNPMSSPAFDPNLVDGIQVDQSAELINFITLNPTLTPTFSNRTSLGGYGFNSSRVTAQGTAGSIGYAAIVSARGTRSVLDGATYADTTGESYIHDGGSHGGAIYLATSAQVGASTTASVRASEAWQRGIPTGDVLEGDLPLGYGLGASAVSRATNYSANVSTALQNGIVQFAISHAGQTSYVAEPSDQIFGVPERQSSSYLYGGTLLNLDATLMTGRTPTHIDLVYDRDGATSGQAILSESRSSSYSGSIFRGELDRIITKVSAVSLPAYASFAFAGPYGAAGVRIIPSFEDRSKHLRGNVGFGTNVDAQVRSSGGNFDAPSNALYDCAARTILVQGPSDPPQVVRNTGVDASLSYAPPRVSITLNAFDKLYQNVSLTDALAPLSAFDARALPPDYLASLQANYSRLAGCSGPTPAPDAIFVEETMSGLNVRYSAMDLSTSIVMSPAVRVSGFFNANSARLLRAPPLLASPNSPYIVGSQLPNAPLHRAGATLEWSLSRARLQALATWTYVGVNNQNNLPGFSITTIGLERQLSSNASLDVVASNVGRSYQAYFASTRFAVPLATNAGPLLLDARPLAPPQIFIRANFRYGPH